ncbi:hypothetical protein [Adhaeribacter aquaticus]|uniref:hypothetical protein n=1 Tax=Adhaeribacter aquaticus TaxID=299567 RepID=UPI0012F852AA|nr:hypothetical protein [Adhaeribacter aquaticus]
MQRLIDYIYTQLEEQHLSRVEVLEHLNYLEEIITPSMSIAEQVKYLAYKVQLNRRLIQMDYFIPVNDASFSVATQPGKAYRPRN